MAQITIQSFKWDIRAILKAAGVTDQSDGLVEGTTLTVDSVSQAALDAAVAAYNNLGPAQAKANQIIDETAEEVRLKFITAGDGQSAVYQEKAEEAADYKVAGYPVDLTSYPFIQAEVNATGKTNQAAADDILAQKSAWIATAASIEEERLGGKKNVNDAADVAAVKSARDTAITALKGI